jgi:hypothetical protein
MSLFQIVGGWPVAAAFNDMEKEKESTFGSAIGRIFNAP